MEVCIFMVTTKKLSRDLESLHVPIVSAKRRKCKIGKRNGHGKVKDKYFVYGNDTGEFRKFKC